MPEFLRLRRVARSAGLEVRFEDRMMDVTVLDGADLVLYCEVKETAAQIDDLLRGMAAHSIDFERADRGNEPLRTAKRLMAFRPQILSLLGLGKRYEFRVEYPTDREVVPSLVEVRWRSPA